jgi:hypothetical protein
MILYLGAVVDRRCCNTARKNPPVSCRCGYMRMLSFAVKPKTKCSARFRTIAPGRVLPSVANGSVRAARYPSHQEAKRRSLRMCRKISCHGQWLEAILSNQAFGQGSEAIRIRRRAQILNRNVQNCVQTRVEDIPGTVLSASATTASFSTGFSEQVEYTILPP